ncbi:sulfotransferase (plasmid) [Falsihalocynthiibacter sp. SS001]|uniref:sulfotransferase family protein n=1 Tax=Falsihalocynthiibacter sp. SS001 TaxID=3349698 RepID=UPI0036D3F424
MISAPIVIVGQPRSGSTILTRWVNNDQRAFVLNDFYVLQRIDALGLWGPLSSGDAREIAMWVYRILEIRCTQEIGKTLEQPVHLSLADLAIVKSLANGPWDEGILWSDVIGQILHRAAELAGADFWGWNTPQDHQHLERIFAGFPDAKVLCQLRQPDAMLASYKNVDGWWHDARRYNPMVLALAWKRAAQNAASWSARKPSQVKFIRYEDLVRRTPETTTEISNFLGIGQRVACLGSFGRNSSMQGKKPKKVTGLESWVAYRICGREAAELGFSERVDARCQFGDFVEAARITGASFSLLVSDYLFNSDRRRRLIRLLFKT